MTYLISDEVFEKHRTGETHPESPERVRVIREGFQNHPNDWKFVSPEKCDESALKTIHKSDYVEKVARYSGQERVLDGDTVLCRDSYEVDRCAVGSALKLGEMVVEKDNSGFAVLRPPGHHAEADRGMGFCLFNNIALVAEKLSRAGQRPGIIDIDAHHGNGTQDFFYERADVFYASFHQYPFFPGSGAAAETGRGEGEGTNLNIPLIAGSGWPELQEGWEKIGRKLMGFEPDVLLVSAGFDGHVEDSLTALRLTDEAFLKIASDLNEWSKQLCDGKILALLEGGYNLKVLRDLVPEFVAVWRE